MKAIEIRDLWYAYPDGAQALCGATLDVEEGERLGLVGPNGAGKSTLLLAMLGFVPAKGTVRVGDLALSRATVRQVRRRLGIVFQDSDDQLFMPTVFDDVAFGPLCMGLGAQEVRARVSEALGQVGAAELADRAPYHLSGGEKRRVALATVLAMRPETILLDEPSGNLDPRSRRHLIDLLGGLGGAMVLATHDLEMVLEVCSRVAVMSGGRVVAGGPPRTVLGDAELMARHGLEAPPSLARRAT